MAELCHERQTGAEESQVSDVPSKSESTASPLGGNDIGTVDPCNLATAASLLGSKKSGANGPKTVTANDNCGSSSQLPNDRPTPQLPPKSLHRKVETEEPSMPKSFGPTSSPTSTVQSDRGPLYPELGKDGICRMHRFSLYETATRYYLVGGDTMDSQFRVLKIDRTAEETDLSVAEDAIVYTKKEMNQLLNAVDDGNKSTGGLKLKCSTWGLLGFIRFTGAYYMLLITKRSQVAMVGGHYIYQIDGTELVPLASPSMTRFRVERHPEEARFIGILSNLDLSRSFYFSYSYDITRTLQHNIIREREAVQKGHLHPAQQDCNQMFVWNHYLLRPMLKTLNNAFDWCLPIVHGFIDQATISIYGRTVYITIIARRSRFFAGARFLKRGANDLGYVANDVETEQIVSEMLTTSFHAPGPRLYANPNYTSYVQHRGSIPLYWTQDNAGVSPKPDIELNLLDPFYGAAALHFDNLFERYGSPIFVLNLIKARERTPRESKLLDEYTNAIRYLNQFLPDDNKITYRAWDMSRAAKSRDQDVIGTLESIAEEVLGTTGFFRNGDEHINTPKLQNGVARTNCIDCIDRTNAAQFVIGKRALGHQLHALGVISDTSLDYDTDAVNLFTHMYHDHGDTIAIQYGGSHLVNTMETYRKINQWTSQSRDMVESFKRYYNNSFLDGQRQEAYNLFLGNYIFALGQPMLWDLSTDYYLHHAHPRTWSGKRRKSYINWFTPEFLRKQKMPPVTLAQTTLHQNPAVYIEDYWLEYYRPLALSSFQRIFSFKMNSTLRYIPSRSTQEGRYDLSPFRLRTGLDQEVPEKRDRMRRGWTVSDPQDEDEHCDDASSLTSHTAALSISKASQLWLQPQLNEKPSIKQRVAKEPQVDIMLGRQSRPKPPEPDVAPLSKSLTAQWTLDQFVDNSLAPSMTKSEAEEYERYVSHPLNLPLVVSTQNPPDPDSELLSYISSVTSAGFSTPYSSEEDMADYAEFLLVSDNPLTVTEADAPKKRYKAYRQWLKGKSLFKQQRVDP
ncbi:MAG: phosphatidylinositol-3,5-bisphosphate 5-phosphatase [Pleopsidium flavum]|nr:MAG: phosphatidylinositol-3,5-bisphosphate 5-phosphatase [Pleopsidium flavum]